MPTFGEDGSANTSIGTNICNVVKASVPFTSDAMGFLLKNGATCVRDAVGNALASKFEWGPWETQRSETKQPQKLTPRDSPKSACRKTFGAPSHGNSSWNKCKWHSIFDVPERERQLAQNAECQQNDCSPPTQTTLCTDRFVKRR